MDFRFISICAAISLGTCTYTFGTNVSSEQAKQFVVGQSTITDMEAKLGHSTKIQANSDSTKTLLYEYSSMHQKVMNFLPIAVHSQLEQSTDKTNFIFSSVGVLQSYDSDTGSDILVN